MPSELTKSRDSSALERQLCSLELAKRLKELGCKQESFFLWNDNTEPATLWREDALEATLHEWSWDRIYSAYTVAELGEMLHEAGKDSGEIIDTVSESPDQEPHRWCVAIYKKIEHIEAHSKKHRAGIYEIGHLEHVEMADVEADARAKMLIHLLEKH